MLIQKERRGCAGVASGGGVALQASECCLIRMLISASCLHLQLPRPVE